MTRRIDSIRPVKSIARVRESPSGTSIFVKTPFDSEPAGSSLRAIRLPAGNAQADSRERLRAKCCNVNDLVDHNTSVDHNMSDGSSSIFAKAPPRGTLGEFLFRLTDQRKEDKFAGDNNVGLADSQWKKQVSNILDLLRYAEVEIAELNLETATVLLGAAIADLVKNLE